VLVPLDSGINLLSADSAGFVGSLILNINN